MKSLAFMDIAAEQQALLPELQAAAHRVIQSGVFIDGPEVSNLEIELASFLQVAEVVTVNSGTDALFLSFKALEIGFGCEVIVPSFTFVASVSAIVNAGAHPVFIDCAANHYLLDTDLLESVITSRAKAILVVHLFGQAVDMAAVLHIAKRYSLHVIEDVAQAFGGMYQGAALGSLGTTGAFSFYPTKNLGAMGDGGAIATNDLQLAKKLRRLKNHGRLTHSQYQEPAYNSRLDEIQAAFLMVKLAHVVSWNQRRVQIATLYDELLSELPLKLPNLSFAGNHVYSLFVVALEQRDMLHAHLSRMKLGSAIYYREPCHQMAMFSEYKSITNLSHTDKWASTALALPIYPSLTDASVREICRAIQEWMLSSETVGT